MFYECKKLISLPEISKWNTSNIMEINGLFCECFSLISISDISSWNTSNTNNISKMFSNCINLESLPDISKWNTENIFQNGKQTMLSIWNICFQNAIHC